MDIKLGPKLLHIKLVIMFISFGLLVALLSILLVTGFQTISIFRDFSDNLSEDIRKEFNMDEPDFFYRMFAIDPRRKQSLALFIEKRIPLNFADRIRVSIFSSPRENREWEEMTSLGGLFHNETLNTGIPTEALNRAIDDERFYFKPFLPGSDKLKTIYIDLSEADDTRHTVVRLIYEAEEFRMAMERHEETLVTFSIMVFIFSLVMGIILAGRLSIPIRHLSSKAEELAEGNMCVRFESNRKDDIGILARSMDTMSLNLKHRFESMQTMNRIDRAVLSSVSRRELLFNVAGYISEQFGNAAVAVMSHREEGLVQTAMIPHYSNLDDRLIMYSSLEYYESDESEIMEINMASEAGQHLQKLKIFPPELICKKLVVIPILHNEQRAASFLMTRNEFSELDKEALSMLADQAGVALKSMVGMEQQEQMFQGTLMALTRSVDAKSRWTAGHSGRVAHLAEALAKRLELSAQDVQTVRISALLHDIGKLGIPEAILDKPGRLSDEEFALIKSHPEKGDTIIKEIPGFEQIRLGVRHHHEKWDGSGYPDGLEGKDIPLIARILTLADVYDAVTEDRPYRKGFSKERLLQFLEEQRGRLFDPELLDVFLPLVEEES